MTKITRLYLLLIFVVSLTSLETINAKSNTATYAFSNIQRVRIDFKMPDGFTRHLLLGFTKDNSASDAYDYGYDALNADAFPYDLNWLVDDRRCVIQGVGAFDNTKKYPFWMFMSQGGNIEISLDTLENFETVIDVFVYDAYLDSYHQINDESYKNTMASGEYTDRFYLAFKDTSSSDPSAKNSLSVEDNILANTQIKYLNSSKELYIDSNGIEINKLNLFNIKGQQIMGKEIHSTSEIKMPLHAITSGLNIVSIETDQGIFSKKVLIH